MSAFTNDYIREVIGRHTKTEAPSIDDPYPTTTMPRETFVSLLAEILRLREAGYDALLDDAFFLIHSYAHPLDEADKVKQRIYEKWVARERMRREPRHARE